MAEVGSDRFCCISSRIEKPNAHSLSPRSLPGAGPADWRSQGQDVGNMGAATEPLRDRRGSKGMGVL